MLSQTPHRRLRRYIREVADASGPECALSFQVQWHPESEHTYSGHAATHDPFGVTVAEGVDALNAAFDKVPDVVLKRLAKDAYRHWFAFMDACPANGGYDKAGSVPRWIKAPREKYRRPRVDFVNERGHNLRWHSIRVRP